MFLRKVWIPNPPSYGLTAQSIETADKFIYKV